MLIQLTPKDKTVNLDLHKDFGFAAPLLKAAFAMAGAECVVTSGRDGVHSRKTAHDDGNAIDLRRWGVDMELITFCTRLAKMLNEMLPASAWYVVLEPDHIHLERCDKGKAPNIKGWKASQFFYTKGSNG